MKKLIVLVAAFVFACAVIAGCSPAAPSSSASSSSQSQSSSADKSQVVVAMSAGSAPEKGFNPVYGWGDGEHVHEPLIQSTLITTDENLNFANDLATGYDVSADGLTWTFKIRIDAKFTDGKALTAHDVAFTINQIVNATGSEADLSMVEKAEATDDATAVIHLNKPFNALLYSLAVTGIVPEHAYGDKYGIDPKATVGSGRYMLEQFDEGEQAILVANPDYYGEAPKMQRVVVLFMEEDAALAAVRSGNADVAYTSAVYSDTKVDGYSLAAYDSVDCRGISMPVPPAGSPEREDATVGKVKVGNDVTSDRAFRQAVNYGVDRAKLVDDILNGYGEPAYSVADGLPWASSAMMCETDVAKAKQIMEAGGWALGSDGIYAKGGLRASAKLYYPASDSVRQAFANEFANQMKALGIEITPVGSSWDGADSIYEHEYTDMVLWGWGANSPNQLYSLYYSTSDSNFACYGSPTVDAYMDQALAAPAVADSYELWQKAQWDGTSGVAPQGEATWVWLANIEHLYFVKDGLQVAHQKPHPHGHGWSLLNNVDQWTWK
ncbi:MAG: ABC transporter substrate-binding protein [Eggerthellaceae bacterium]|nr:ABC transporter substrate-binding protein [Eggerthellaceae bacterium]